MSDVSVRAKVTARQFTGWLFGEINGPLTSCSDETFNEVFSLWDAEKVEAELARVIDAALKAEEARRARTSQE